jgi:hypothetical protein
MIEVASARVGLSFFVRQLPRHPPKYLPQNSQELAYCNLYPMKPWRFAVGLSIISPQGRPLPPPAAIAEHGTNPVHVQFFIGRIEELDGSQQILARLWERPSGRESLVPLSATEHLRGQRFRPGSMLHVWTWVEYDNEGRRHDWAWIEVQPLQLTPGEREVIRRIAQAPEAPDET